MCRDGSALSMLSRTWTPITRLLSQVSIMPETLNRALWPPVNLQIRLRKPLSPPSKTRRFGSFSRMQSALSLYSCWLHRKKLTTFLWLEMWVFSQSPLCIFSLPYNIFHCVTSGFYSWEPEISLSLPPAQIGVLGMVSHPCHKSSQMWYTWPTINILHACIFPHSLLEPFTSSRFSRWAFGIFPPIFLFKDMEMGYNVQNFDIEWVTSWTLGIYFFFSSEKYSDLIM